MSVMSGSHIHQIRIGIIGPQPIVNSILRIIETFPSFAPVPRVYRHEDEAPALAEEIGGNVEVILFADPLSHRKVKERMNVPVPTLHVPITDAGLYKALFYAQQSGKLSGGISVDTLSETMVMRTLKDLGISGIRTVIFDGPVYASKEKLIAFHQEQYRSGVCSIAFTGVGSAAQELNRLDIPNQWHRGVSTRHPAPSPWRR